jgi:hypothetical protein
LLILFAIVSFLRRQISKLGCHSEFIPHLMREWHDNNHFNNPIAEIKIEK